MFGETLLVVEFPVEAHDCVHSVLLKHVYIVLHEKKINNHYERKKIVTITRFRTASVTSESVFKHQKMSDS